MDTSTPLQSSPPPQIENPPSITPQRSPAKGSVPLLLTIALMIVSAVIGYYAAILKTTKSDQTETTYLVEATPTPTASPDAMYKDSVITPSDSNVYTVPALKLQFQLPESFKKYGEFREIVFPGESGMQICATFETKTSFLVEQAYAGSGGCVANKFGVGTTSVDFSAGREGTFGDLQGFIFKNNAYYAQAPLEKEWQIPSNLVTELENSAGLEIIKVKGANIYSDVMEMELDVTGTPGEGKIGALVNTNDSNYPGFTLEMELSEELTEEVFDQILSTIKIN